MRRGEALGVRPLLKSNVVIEGDRILVDFKGKARKPINLEISNGLLARVAARAKGPRRGRVSSTLGDVQAGSKQILDWITHREYVHKRKPREGVRGFQLGEDISN